jgi:hypothetical protein
MQNSHLEELNPEYISLREAIHRYEFSRASFTHQLNFMIFVEIEYLECRQFFQMRH